MYYPLFFAAPSRKWHGSEVHGINGKAHLAIYRISPRAVQKRAKTRDQFGTRLTEAFRSVLLAVPCTKGKWEVAK